MDYIEFPRQIEKSLNTFHNEFNKNIEKSLKKYIEIKQCSNEYIRENFERVIDIYTDVEIIYNGRDKNTRIKVLTINKHGLCWTMIENWKEDLLK